MIVPNKVNVTGKEKQRVRDTSRPRRRVDSSAFAAALGAEPIGAPHSRAADLISLAELGNQLIGRLRSTGGRPSLADASQRCKVPLSTEDIAALGKIIDTIEQETG